MREHVCQSASNFDFLKYRQNWKFVSISQRAKHIQEIKREIKKDGETRSDVAIKEDITL